MTATSSSSQSSLTRPRPTARSMAARAIHWLFARLLLTTDFAAFGRSLSEVRNESCSPPVSMITFSRQRTVVAGPVFSAVTCKGLHNCMTAHVTAASCKLPEVPLCSDGQHPTLLTIHHVRCDYRAIKLLFSSDSETACE